MDTHEPQSINDDGIDDWLWDLEDRYDVGPIDELPATQLVAAASDPRLSQLRRYRRSNGPSQAAGWQGERTGPMAVLAVDQGEPRYRAPAPPVRTGGRRWTVAAVVVVIAGVGGMAWLATHQGSGHSGTPSVAVGTQTTTTAEPVGPIGGPVTVPSTDATVPDTEPATVAAPASTPATSPAAGAVFTATGATHTTPARTPTNPVTVTHTPSATTTTAPHQVTPPPVTTVPPPSTTAAPPPTTTPSTIPPVTTVPTTPPSTVPLGG
jgi:hypothetical protein